MDYRIINDIRRMWYRVECEVECISEGGSKVMEQLEMWKEMKYRLKLTVDQSGAWIKIEN